MKYLINLFPSKEQNVLDKLIFFAFHYLRYILVITQFVVICVFFYRFKVDQEIVDLKDSLEQKQYIVQATAALLKDVELIHGKIENIKTAIKRQNVAREMYQYFFQIFPSALSLTSFHMTEASLEIQGLAKDSLAVESFYKQLQEEKRFKTVDLKNVKRTPEGYSFDLTLENFILSNQP